jgi:hypothetical protein
MLAFVISAIAYLFALALGSYLLSSNDIELPRMSRWIILNTFAFVLSYIAALPF